MNTVQYKCPYCGGELVFNPEKQQFSCPYCASDFTEAEMEARYKEQNADAQEHADPDAQTLKDENDTAAFEEQTRLYECPSCGAQIIAEETTSATFCYYCHWATDRSIPTFFCPAICCSAGNCRKGI